MAPFWTRMPSTPVSNMKILRFSRRVLPQAGFWMFLRTRVRRVPSNQTARGLVIRGWLQCKKSWIYRPGVSWWNLLYMNVLEAHITCLYLFDLLWWIEMLIYLEVYPCCTAQSTSYRTINNMSPQHIENTTLLHGPPKIQLQQLE